METINPKIGRLDVLVNNAGVMEAKDYAESADGFEMHFVSNHLGYFLLTNLLMSKILAAQEVIINVSSIGHELAEVNSEDPNFQVRENSSMDPMLSPCRANIISRAARRTTRGSHLRSPRRLMFCFCCSDRETQEEGHRLFLSMPWPYV